MAKVLRVVALSLLLTLATSCGPSGSGGGNAYCIKASTQIPYDTAVAIVSNPTSNQYQTTKNIIMSEFERTLWASGKHDRLSGTPTFCKFESLTAITTTTTTTPATSTTTTVTPAVPPTASPPHADVDFNVYIQAKINAPAGDIEKWDPSAQWPVYNLRDIKALGFDQCTGCTG